MYTTELCKQGVRFEDKSLVCRRLAVLLVMLHTEHREIEGGE